MTTPPQPAPVAPEGTLPAPGASRGSVHGALLEKLRDLDILGAAQALRVAQQNEA